MGCFRSKNSNYEKTNEGLTNRTTNETLQKDTEKTDTNSKLQLQNDINIYFNTNGVIDEKGMTKIGETLNIDIYTHLFLTYFMYNCKSIKLDEITQEEYKKGLQALKVSSINQLKSRVNEYKSSTTTDSFKQFYEYLFKINTDKRKKKISFEVTELYFKDLFLKRKYLTDFLNYIHKVKAIDLNHDQWNSFLLLFNTFGNEYPKGYEVETDSWPLLFDDFYYYYCEQYKINIEKKDKEKERE